MKGKFSMTEFESLDQLLAVGETLPVAETVPLTRLTGARRWSNSGDYRAICTADHIWQVAGKNYRVVQHGDLIRAVVSQLAQLGLDDTHGRVDTWHMQGRVWITALSPQEFQPLPGDTYRDGVIFGNSLDASSAVTAAYYSWRQICKNGLHAWTRELAARKIHTGTSSIQRWLKLSIRRIREQRPQFEQMIQQAAETRIEEDVNAVLKRLNIGPKVSHKIVERLEHTNNLTMYDLGNALTNYATHELSTRPLAREKYEDMARRVMVAPTMPTIRPHNLRNA